jgi:hypothetical protein
MHILSLTPPPLPTTTLFTSILGRYIGNCTVQGEAGDEVVEEAHKQITNNPFDSHSDPCT